MPDPTLALALRVGDDPFFAAHALAARFGPDWFEACCSEWNLTPEQTTRLALCRRPATDDDVARIADYVPCDAAAVAELK